MLWLAFAAILATPVLLGVIPGSDATAARRLIIRCGVVGLILGFLLGLCLVVASLHVPLRSGLLLPTAWGAGLGVSVGVLSVAVRREVARFRTQRSDRDLRSNDR